MVVRKSGAVILTVLALAGCHKAGKDAQTENAVAPAENAATPAAPAAPAPQVTPPAGGFAIDKIPVSTAPLGAFPYIGLPDGYAWGEHGGEGETRDFDHFPFWTGSALHDVEGKLFMSTITSKTGKTYSAFELQKNLDTVIAAAGGVKITNSKIPRAITETLSEDVTVGKNSCLGDVYNVPAQVSVIRRPDREIWINYVPDSYSASMCIVETKPFVATAKLLPADALKQAIYRSGKAVVHVNFATDATKILPDSQSQIGAIVTLLKQNPTLKLAINGYTDETGSSSHNQTLSEGRAASVKQALVAAGIGSDRLTSKGFGASAPVADNSSEAGKAQNRRVELVKI
ncbi:OmpA family protein [Sphingomonas sp.]|uniref:OmpA family protein n=1 Tax=Sphingomonas sp. TaxID=28214 RepID=UPI003B3A9A1D